MSNEALNSNASVERSRQHESSVNTALKSLEDILRYVIRFYWRVYVGIPFQDKLKKKGPASRDKDAFERLFHKSKDPSSRTYHEKESLAICLLEIYDDIILLDIEIAVAEGIPDKCWNNIWHWQIEEYRSILLVNPTEAISDEMRERKRIAGRELRYILQNAHAYYSTLIQCLACDSGFHLKTFAATQYLYTSPDGMTTLDQDPSLKKRAKSIIEVVYKSSLRVGDLRRYWELLFSKVKDWNLCIDYYSRTLLISPHFGHSYSQIASIYSYGTCNDVELLNSMLWFSLGVAVHDSSPYIRSNLEAFYEKLDEDAAMKLPSIFMLLHKMWYQCMSDSLADVTHLWTGFFDIFDQLFTATLSQSASVQRSLKLESLVILSIFAYEDLDARFTVSACKPRIRSYQLVIVSFLFRMITALSQATGDFSASEEDSEFNEFKVDILRAFGVCCLWISHANPVNPGDLVIPRYLAYMRVIKCDIDFPAVLRSFAVSFCVLASLLRPLIDDDDIWRATWCDQKDIKLLGFPGLVPYFRGLSVDSLLNIRIYKPDEGDYYSRIWCLVDHLSTPDSSSYAVPSTSRKTTNPIKTFYFSSDNEDPLYLVDERKRRDFQRQMKSLAMERLKDQITSLEADLNQQESIPIIIPVLDVLMRHFKSFKRILKSRKRPVRVFISYLILQKLDWMKSDEDGVVGRKAREVIRFLDTCFRPNRTIALPNPVEIQHPDQTCPLPWHVPEIIGEDSVTSDDLRSVIGFYLFVRFQHPSASSISIVCGNGKQASSYAQMVSEWQLLQDDVKLPSFVPVSDIKVS